MATVLDDRRVRPSEKHDSQEVVVRVVSEGGAGDARPARRRAAMGGGGWLRTIGIIGVLGAIAVAVLLLAKAIGGFDINLFGTTKVDRSAPVVLRELRDVSTYTAATGEFEATVDIEEKMDWVPSFIKGERTIFVGVGTVDATVDFSALTQDAVTTNGDGSVTVTLPRPTLANAHVDPARSDVKDRDRGLIDRAASVFSDSPTSEREVYLVAEKRIARAARGSELRNRAERNTQEMLEGLLGKLGFDRVQVVFSDAPSDAAVERAA